MAGWRLREEELMLQSSPKIEFLPSGGSQSFFLRCSTNWLVRDGERLTFALLVAETPAFLLLLCGWFYSIFTPWWGRGNGKPRNPPAHLIMVATVAVESPEGQPVSCPVLTLLLKLRCPAAQEYSCVFQLCLWSYSYISETRIFRWLLCKVEYYLYSTQYLVQRIRGWSSGSWGPVF